jgi:hypothetical protein
LKPEASTDSWYVPTGKKRMEYSPAGFVFVAVGTPVAALVAVTVAPARMAPEESVTMPRIAPVTVCADAGRKQGKKRTIAHASDLQADFIIFVSVEPDITGVAASGSVVQRLDSQERAAS